MLSQSILEDNCGWLKLEALLYNVTIPLARHMDVLYTLKLSFRSNSSQWRSICIFEVYIHISLIEFFGGSILSKAWNLSNIL